jgi:protein involved in polysaccharide export with SLBB domain
MFLIISLISFSSSAFAFNINDLSSGQNPDDINNIKDAYKDIKIDPSMINSNVNLDRTSNYLGEKSNYSGNTIDENIYKLGPGDQIAVNIIIGDNDRTVDSVFTIGPDGKIYYPKIGELYLSGLEITKAKELINKKIKQIYNGQYSFSLRLLQPKLVQLYLSGADNKPAYMVENNFVYIYGEVAKAGRFEFLPNKKFSDYISYAGGPTARASLSAATITRAGKKYNINAADVIFNGNLKADMEIMSGDVVNVPNQFFYFNDFYSLTSLLYAFLAFYSTFIKK